jgi:hypothetical protein
MPVPDHTLHQSLEQVRRRVTRPAIEPKLEFIQIPLKVLSGDRALMGAKHPALEQGENTVDRWQENMRFNLATVDDVPKVNKPRTFQVVVTLPPVGVYRRFQIQFAFDEVCEFGFRAVGNHGQSNPTESSILLFYGADDDSLASGASARNPRLGRSDPSFINLNCAR